MATPLISNEKLKTQLDKHGIGVVKLSEMTGLSRSLCSLILSGKRPVTTNTLNIVLQTFPHIKLDDILNNEYVK